MKDFWESLKEATTVSVCRRKPSRTLHQLEFWVLASQFTALTKLQWVQNPAYGSSASCEGYSIGHRCFVCLTTCITWPGVLKTDSMEKLPKLAWNFVVDCSFSCCNVVDWIFENDIRNWWIVCRILRNSRMTTEVEKWSHSWVVHNFDWILILQNSKIELTQDSAQLKNDKFFWNMSSSWVMLQDLVSVHGIFVRSKCLEWFVISCAISLFWKKCTGRPGLLGAQTYVISTVIFAIGHQDNQIDRELLVWPCHVESVVDHVFSARWMLFSAMSSLHDFYLNRCLLRNQYMKFVLLGKLVLFIRLNDQSTICRGSVWIRFLAVIEGWNERPKTAVRDC